MWSVSHFFMYPNGPFFYMSDDDITDNSDDEGPSSKSKSKEKEVVLPADPREHPFGHPAESSARAKVGRQPRRAEADDMISARLSLTSNSEHGKSDVRAAALRSIDKMTRNERELNALMYVELFFFFILSLCTTFLF
jgi:hypothetical protein